LGNEGTAFCILKLYLEVLTAVIMKITIFWDKTPCSLLKVNRRFGGTYRFHLRGLRIILARNKRESMWQADLAGFLLGLFFDSEDRRRYFPPKRRLTFDELDGVIFQ
jgi:hypothetical protein